MEEEKNENSYRLHQFVAPIKVLTEKDGQTGLLVILSCGCQNTNKQLSEGESRLMP